MNRTVVNIISGFLGTGKTTAINRLLAARPTGERWVVVVNEFGEMGIDGVLLPRPPESLGTAGDASPSDVVVREIPGGCICCTAGVQFRDTLVRVVRELRPDRVLIEPSGIATVGSIIDTLRSPGLAGAIALHTVVTLVDPLHWRSPDHRRSEAFQDQVEAADILLANRTDLCDQATTDHFIADGMALFPPKIRVDRVEHAAIAPELLDLVSDRRPAADGDQGKVRLISAILRPSAGGVLGAVHPVHGAEYGTVAGQFSREEVFDETALARWISLCRRRPEVLRIKGVFRTNGGWIAWNATPEEQSPLRTSHRRDSRIQLVVKRGVGDPPVDEEQLAMELRALLRPSVQP